MLDMTVPDDRYVRQREYEKLEKVTPRTEGGIREDAENNDQNNSSNNWYTWKPRKVASGTASEISV